MMPARPATNVAAAHRVACGRDAGLQRDLIRLGVLPCAAVALALTVWFTHERLDTLEAAFRAEGTAVARQIAVVSDLSLYAGDINTLYDIARNTVASGSAARVEISNNAGIYVTAGIAVDKLRQARQFGTAVRLRASPGLGDFVPRPRQLGDVGTVRVYLDASDHLRTRTSSILVGSAIGSLALLIAWLSARHMARAVVRPLRRLSATVAALQDGELDARCGPCGKHEIASLAGDIDRMASRLQDDSLLHEERIRAATAEAQTRMVQAEQASRARTRFLASASHDLRQPLHAMGLFIDSLIPSATDTQRPALMRLQEGAHVMSGLLDALLDISRLDANVVSPTLTPVALAALFAQLDGLLGPAARDLGVQLTWRAGGKTVMTDPVLLQRVVGNLVQNAVHHSPGGRVLVTARRCAVGVRIDVRDDGVGIAPIHQTRIFEEFYQVANSERDRRKGFGLGLAICSRIAALLGTRISVRSALQRGSVFGLALPVAPRDAAAPSALQADTPAPSQGLALRCLAIDDNEAIREASSVLLRQWGCEVDEAATGAHAMALLAAPAPHYHVVLCDLQLADNEDGMAVAEQARRLQPDARVVLVSGATTSAVLQRVQQAGVTLLTKPVAPAKLRALLAGIKKGAA